MSRSDRFGPYLQLFSAAMTATSERTNRRYPRNSSQARSAGPELERRERPRTHRSAQRRLGRLVVSSAVAAAETLRHGERHQPTDSGARRERTMHPKPGRAMARSTAEKAPCLDILYGDTALVTALLWVTSE
jgi:hypothetical protein